MSDSDDVSRDEHGNSVHGSADQEVTIERDGEELAEEPMVIEHAPGGGHPVPSARDLAAEQHPGRE